MDATVGIPGIAHVIQQAIAPVFLLTGVGAILGVLINRLGRIVDRHRLLASTCDGSLATGGNEMATLARRSQWIHRAITCCTLCALLICVVISALFIGVELGLDPSRAIALLFVTAMFSLIAGLLCFLREITLATGTIDANRRTPPAT